MLRRVPKENQHLYINSKEVLGIQDFNFDYNLPIDPIRYLGMETVAFAKTKPVTAEISINKLLLDSDEFINFTGDTTFNGHLEYNNNYFAFNSGILNNYTLSCSVNEIPTISTNLTVLGQFGSGVSKVENPLDKNKISIANYGDIQVNLNDFIYNRLQNISISVDTNRSILYKLGHSYPAEIISNPPLVININFGIKVDEYKVKNIRESLCNYKIDNFYINFLEFKTNNNILSFSFPEAIFLGESFQGSISDSSIVNLRYQAYRNYNFLISQRDNLSNSDLKDWGIDYPNF